MTRARRQPGGARLRSLDAGEHSPLRRPARARRHGRPHARAHRRRHARRRLARARASATSRRACSTRSTSATPRRETALADGDEVALIPPVSGGDFRLTAEPLSLDAVVREVQRDEAGAIATFLGTVRNRSRDRKVLYLEYEAYEGMAEETMAELARELTAAARAARGRDPPPRRPGRDRRAERRHRRLLAAPRRRARRLQGGDRHAQGNGAALEERGLRGRRGMDRAGLMSHRHGTVPQVEAGGRRLQLR